MQERVKQFIAEYNEQGHTIVLSTHHVEVAQALCTQVSILEDGAFIEQLDPRELAEGRSVRDTYLEAVDESALSEVSE
jgi:ABC-2 type transport system ATP-binding protein